MQIGIDLGATKIEYVLLDNNNKELERNRSETPKDFGKTIILITEHFRLTPTQCCSQMIWTREKPSLDNEDWS